MATFTIIVGSAFRDAGENNYIVDAPTVEAACEYAVRIAKAHDCNLLTALYAFEGVVTFLPTVFNAPGGPYTPEVIDLRPPVVPVEIAAGEVYSPYAFVTLDNRTAAQKRRFDNLFVTLGHHSILTTKTTMGILIDVPDNIFPQALRDLVKKILGQKDIEIVFGRDRATVAGLARAL